MLSPEMKISKYSSAHDVFLQLMLRHCDVFTFPVFHCIGVDFDEGSPVSFRWNSLDITSLSKYGLLPNL